MKDLTWLAGVAAVVVGAIILWGLMRLGQRYNEKAEDHDEDRKGGWSRKTEPPKESEK